MSGTIKKGSLVKGTGGSGGGGSASFPTIVTSSGSSLPSASGYQLNDTFLNTSDKKIYKTGASGYEWNTNVTYGDVTIDFTTGIVTKISTGYSNPRILERTIGNTLWNGNKTYQIKFKITTLPTSYDIGLISFWNRKLGSQLYSKNLGIGHTNKKIIYTEVYSISTSSHTVNKTEVCFNTEIEINKEYTIKINKTSSVCNIALFEGETEKEVNSFEITDFPNVDVSAYINYGIAILNGGAGYGQMLYSNGEIYLLDTSGDVLVPSSELSWDNGVAIEDKNEYADKTNGILYLYENSELVKIGGALKKKVYTISADNTSILDVSSDFTKVVDVLKNGVELALTDDYTISSGVITFVTALSTTDKITVKGE